MHPLNSIIHLLFNIPFRETGSVKFNMDFIVDQF